MQEFNSEPVENVPGGQAPSISLRLDDLPQATLADLPEKLRKGAAAAGWTELMPVQAKAMPYLFAQRDMMIQSRTGSGKTGAYLLPILEMINPRLLATQALVMVPTRELALQVAREAELLGEAFEVRSIAVYGGVGYQDQLQAFKAGAQLVIGTPGRILDHLLRRSLSLSQLQVLIFDEADRMLSMGFYPDMRRIASYLPAERHVSTFMFSATFPVSVTRLAQEFMYQPGFLNLSSDHIHVTETEHIYYVVPGMSKDTSLVRIIEVENPTSALIFCNTKARVEYVSVVLQRFGYDADHLTSDLSQVVREKVMERVRQGKLRFLVATDVAARGIDLPDLSHVIQYEPPDDAEGYIHRAGRTGRAGASGTAITLTSAAESLEIARIGKRFGIELQERVVPTEDEVARVTSERAIALLEARLRGRDRLQVERMQRFVPLAGSLAESGSAAGLLAMLLDDFYQEHFHAPPTLPLNTDDARLNMPRQGTKPQRNERRRRRR